MANEEIQVSDVIGRSGKHQIMTTILAAYNEAILGISLIVLQFLLVEVSLSWDWNSSSENTTVYLSSENTTVYLSSKCKMEDLIRMNSSSNISNENSRIIVSSQYMTRSLTENFNLVCEWSWLISLSKALPHAGAVVGSLFLGPLCNKYGRSRTCIGFQTGLLISQLVILFSPWYPLFAVACAATGFCTVPAAVVYVIQATELIPISWRQWYGTMLRSGMLVGQAFLSGLAWILKDWFYVQLSYTIMIAFSVPMAWYMLDDPAWLLVCGREEDAKKNLNLILERNGRNFQEFQSKANQWLTAMKEKQRNKKSAEKGKISVLFKNRLIAKYTVLSAFSTSISAFVLMGVVANVEAFGSGLYHDQMLMCGASALGVVAAIVFLKKYSIRKMQIVCFLITTVTAIAYVITYEYAVARTVLCTLFRAVSGPVASTILVYLTEIFPTTVRVVASGFNMTFFRLASAAGSFMKDLGDKTQVYIPFILFATLTSTAAFLILFLPETKGRPLIQTVDELMSKNRSKKAEAKEDKESIQTKF